MVYEIVVFEKEKHVGIISLSGLADRENVSSLAYELIDLCREINADAETRVVVIRGTGENPFRVNSSDITPFSFVDPIAHLKQPVIAAIDGDATGAGLELALACDVRIGIEGGRFGLPQVRQGLIPSHGGTQRMARLVGPGKALEMILTGETIESTEARVIGLLNRVVPADQLMETAMTLGHEMAAKSPVAMSYVKEALHSGMDLTIDQGMRMELGLYLLLFTTQDRIEGIDAFKEKRTPEFKGE